MTSRIKRNSKGAAIIPIVRLKPHKCGKNCPIHKQ